MKKNPKTFLNHNIVRELEHLQINAPHIVSTQLSGAQNIRMAIVLLSLKDDKNKSIVMTI